MQMAIVMMKTIWLLAIGMEETAVTMTYLIMTFFAQNANALVPMLTLNCLISQLPYFLPILRIRNNQGVSKFFYIYYAF